MKDNILKLINADYILQMNEFKGINIDSIITPDLLSTIQKIVDDNFNEYIKSSNSEKQIKKTGTDYFIIIYLMTIFNILNEINEPAGYKARLKEFITKNNNIGDLLYILPNLDFYIGSCGIEAQKLAASNK